MDPLLGLLTGREQLAMYARLKGVPSAAVWGEVDATLVRVSLPTEMAARPCWQYSGGNKRKLALAMALVGHPAVVFLDEPSSGMDPQVRLLDRRPTNGVTKHCLYLDYAIQV